MELRQRKKMRLQGYDYGRAGNYFVTICTKNREHFFGAIVGGDVPIAPHDVPIAPHDVPIAPHIELSKIGKIVDDTIADRKSVV